MSNPSRQQRRFPSRTPVRISRNYPKLPPIPQTARSIDPDNDSDKHISIIHPAEHTLPSTKLVPITPVLPNEDLSTKPLLDGTDIESNRDSSTSIDVSEFWAKLRRHIANESLSNPDDHGCQQTPNKVVRIFVSSTFTDFFNEREILIKKVFPELRDELEPAGLQIIDCDLRWGVPKDSTTEQTILTCLEELDRCFEDNGQPFFIGLISDKYGWVPKLHELPDSIKERYRWIDGASITLMEFIHGAFRTHNPNAFFLIRKSENILKNLPEKYTDKFRDKDEISQKQVLELKHQLSQIVPPEHIFQYDCFYNGLDSTTGRERVRVDGLEEFGMKAKEFLSEAIKNWYSENFDNATSIDAEQKQMKTFLLNKTQFFVDRSEEFSMLLKYISDDPIDGKKLHKISADPVDHQPIMSIVSPAGDGKTMLLGKFVLHIEETMKDKFFLFYHFLDGAFHPTGSSFMHANLAQKLNKYLDEHQLISPNTGERPNVTDENFIREAIALLPVPFVIIIDGLDKGDIHHQRKYHEEFLFANYKDLASNHTYMLISSEPNSPLYHEIRRYDYHELYLKPLTIEQRSTYVENFFQRFNKTLESEQKNLIINNKGGEHPLYLAYLCENLRQFGDYSLITKRLKGYPQTTEELIDVLLDEVIVTIGNQPVLDAFFKLLIASNIGILESDVVTMLERYMNNNVDETKRVNVDRMMWSTIRRHLKSFLDTSWIDGHQLITFRHSTLLQKLHKRYFEDKNDELRSIHKFLAEFFLKDPSIKDYSRRRVPYHYEQAHMIKELVAYLRSLESRSVTQIDRQAYLRKYRCKRYLTDLDSVASQRAYVCNVCATLFKLGPYTMTKGSCLICTTPIFGYNSSQYSPTKRDARLCTQHGQPGYPRTIRCVTCKSIRPNLSGTLPTVMDPIPMNICFQCSMSGGAGTRCCDFEIDEIKS